MVLLAAFATCLQRHTGQHDFVIGTPVANRSRLETEELIGCFVNTVALRLRLEGDPTVRRLLGHVREVTLDAFAHEAMPFEQLVDGMQTWRDPGRPPLVQVMFVLQNAVQSKPELDGLAIRQMPIGTGCAKFDLTLDVAEKADGRLLARWEYAAHLFETETIPRMAEHFSVLIEGMVLDPERRLSALPLLAPAERTQVLTAWNRTDDRSIAGLVHRRFEAQAERTPDAVAVVCGEAALSYNALDRDADRLARRLRRLGVGPEVRVAVFLARRLDVVVAIVGVLKAGGAYVPLDQSDPVARLKFMLADSGARVIVTSESLRDRMPAPDDLSVVSLDAPAPTAETDGIDVPEHEIAPGNLAYVLYTSGSTGQPKGVAVQHAALDSYLTWAVRTYPARSAALHTSLSFDLSVTSLFVPLISGGCVELIDETDPLGGLTQRLESPPPIDLLKLTPTHLHALAGLLERRHIDAPPACLVVGGEALLGDRLDLWRERFPETTIVNEYGPTETVVGCCLDVRTLKDAPTGPVPIGRPAPNMRAYVLDAAGEPAPIGVGGELCVGGTQVARGYLNRLALTAERFVPDPFSMSPGARLYRTGDRVRWRADGALEYLSRDDEQLKIRGFRIEPGECERALRRQPGVSDCVVTVRQNPAGEPCLVGYVVGPTRAADLRTSLREHLPAYMVPEAFVTVDAIPRSASGKIDRRALPPPTFASTDIEYVAPRGDVEHRLVEIWTEVLKVPRVGVLDNFFDVGGNSLSLARAHDKLRERWQLPLVELFRHPTVRSLAAYLSDPPPTAERRRDDRDEPVERVAARLSLRAARARSAEVTQ
jgi:amino acid adenylation domain-containing protein